MREGADAFSRGKSRSVSRKCPTWFTPKSISSPSTVSWRWRVMTPAFATSTSSRANIARKASANARTEASEARSSCITRRSVAPVVAASSSSAALPLSTSRQASTTVAPRRARPATVALPIPVFPPVTMQILFFITSPYAHGGPGGIHRPQTFASSAGTTAESGKAAPGRRSAASVGHFASRVNAVMDREPRA